MANLAADINDGAAAALPDEAVEALIKYMLTPTNSLIARL